MNFIKDLILSMLEHDQSSYDIAGYLGVSVSMVSSYKLHNYNPSITVAKTVYTKSNIVLHPFSEESLKYEIAKDKK